MIISVLFYAINVLQVHRTSRENAKKEQEMADSFKEMEEVCYLFILMFSIGSQVSTEYNGIVIKCAKTHSHAFSITVLEGLRPPSIPPLYIAGINYMCCVYQYF